jgi:hypothetical protein
MSQASRRLRAYTVQRGLFARIARSLAIDPSYVSRVARGKRKSSRITQAIAAELKRMHDKSQKIG